MRVRACMCVYIRILAKAQREAEEPNSKSQFLLQIYNVEKTGGYSNYFLGDSESTIQIRLRYERM